MIDASATSAVSGVRSSCETSATNRRFWRSEASRRADRRGQQIGHPIELRGDPARTRRRRRPARGPRGHRRRSGLRRRCPSRRDAGCPGPRTRRSRGPARSRRARPRSARAGAARQRLVDRLGREDEVERRPAAAGARRGPATAAPATGCHAYPSRPRRPAPSPLPGSRSRSSGAAMELETAGGRAVAEVHDRLDVAAEPERAPLRPLASSASRASRPSGQPLGHEHGQVELRLPAGRRRAGRHAGAPSTNGVRADADRGHRDRDEGDEGEGEARADAAHRVRRPSSGARGLVAAAPHGEDQLRGRRGPPRSWRGARPIATSTRRESPR